MEQSIVKMGSGIHEDRGRLLKERERERERQRQRKKEPVSEH